MLENNLLEVINWSLSVKIELFGTYLWCYDLVTV